MKTPKFEKAVDALLTGRPTYRQRAIWWIKANFYRRTWHLNLRPKPILLACLKPLLPSLTPLLGFMFGPSPGITFVQALTWSVVIFAIGMGIVAVERLLSLPKGHASPVEEMLMRASELVRLSEHADSLQKTAARRACLDLIEIYVRTLTSAKEGDIGVSIARYTDNEFYRLRIDDRNSGSKRRMGMSFPGDNVLGHVSCTAGADPRAVNDLRDFGSDACKSPTSSKVAYRSFFIVPLLDTVGSPRPIGYLSIDSIRPYDFYGNRANVLAVECESVIEHIRKLM